MSTLFERIGGAAAVNAAVDKFYEKLLADDRISTFFESVDMERQAGFQKRFLTVAFGGAPKYPGQTLRAAHKHLVEEKGLNDTHFNAVLEHLHATLVELGVPDDVVTEAAAVAESVRSDVLNK
ncbi:MAG: group 1 truncated hemoglobin [Desulfobacter sp.]